MATVCRLRSCPRRGWGGLCEAGGLTTGADRAPTACEAAAIDGSLAGSTGGTAVLARTNDELLPPLAVSRLAVSPTLSAELVRSRPAMAAAVMRRAVPGAVAAPAALRCRRSFEEVARSGRASPAELRRTPGPDGGNADAVSESDGAPAAIAIRGAARARAQRSAGSMPRMPSDSSLQRGIRERP